MNKNINLDFPKNNEREMPQQDDRRGKKKHLGEKLIEWVDELLPERI